MMDEMENYYRTGRGWSLYPISSTVLLHTISSWAEGGEVLVGFPYSGRRRARKGGGRAVRARNPSTFPKLSQLPGFGPATAVHNHPTSLAGRVRLDKVISYPFVGYFWRGA